MSSENLRFPVSRIEQQFWVLSQQGAGSAYNIISAFESEDLDTERFCQACTALTASFPVLTSVYGMDAGGLYREEKPQAEPEFRKTDSDSREAAEVWLKQQASDVFDLENGPLVRVMLAHYGTGTLAAISIHHIVVDLRSKELIAGHLAELYAGLEPAAEVTPYSAFAPAEQEWLGSDKADRARSYWRELLSHSGGEVHLPAQPESQEHLAGYVPLKMPETLWSQVLEYSEQTTSSHFIVMLAAYFYALSRYSGETDFCLAMPLSNRKNEAFRDTCGCFVNTVPLRLTVSAESSFADLQLQTRRAMLAAHRYQELPAVAIMELAAEQKIASRNVFRHGYTFEAPMSLQLQDTDVRALKVNPQHPQLDLFLRCWLDSDGQIQGQFEYDKGVMDSAFVSRFHDYFITLLSTVTAQPSQRLLGAEIMSDADRSLLESVNRTEREYDQTATLKSLFEHQVAATPDHTALIEGEQQLSYAQFNSQADQLAAFLQRTVPGRNPVIAVMVRRSVAMMQAVYGIMKAGAAYLPVDLELPDARIQLMLENAGVSHVISTSEVWPSRELTGVSPLLLDSLDLSSETAPAETDLTPEDLAYIIFTSGSTGAPKGVMNTHRGIVNRLLWMQEQFELKAGERVLQKTPYSFDVSVWELFWPLQTGATLVLAEHDSHKSPYSIDQQICDHQINFIHFVPAMLAAYLSSEPRGGSHLRTVVCSGEELTREHCARFAELLPGVGLFNLYGPTEAAVDVSCWQYSEDMTGPSVPIGVPVSNTQLYVVDDGGARVPVGVMGELLIGGCQVAEGYVNNPDLTAERFPENPFAAGRIYRTGDFARWTAEGALVFHGRRDFQVKLNGVRIELSEIENTVLACPGVELCSVVVVTGQAGNHYLGAYYSLAAGASGPDRDTLAEFLRGRLPKYMMPAQYMQLDSFPLTSSGKVNRRALPDFDVAAVTADQPVAAAENETEQKILDAWKEVLALENCSTETTFFDAGGDSLLLMKVYALLRSEFAGKLNSVDLFSYPTVRALAAYLNNSDSGPAKDRIRSRAERMQQSTSASGMRMRKRPGRSK